MVSGLLLRGLIAGILAGILAAGFSAFAGEPSIERAISFESAAQQAAGEMPEPEIVSRNVQRGVGLLLASVVYGAAIGGLFSLAFAFAYGRVGGGDPRTLSVLLACVGFIAIVLVPDLKYPANPPAIGAPETIGARTAVYFGMLTISVLAMILSTTLIEPLTSRFGSWNGGLLCAAVFVAIVGMAGTALPPVDEVPSDFPANVLWNFRIASLGARAILWATLGLAFGAMTQVWLGHGEWRARSRSA
jgi:predicted cobalt transporter CbtA